MPSDQDRLEALTQELQAAIDQQAATAEILRVISRSPGDLQPVFDAIARHANRLCDGVFSALFRLDGGTIDIVAHDSVSPDQVQALRRVFPVPATRDTLTGRAILDRRIVHVADVTTEPGYALMPLAKEVGYRSFLSVPMQREDARSAPSASRGERPHHSRSSRSGSWKPSPIRRSSPSRACASIASSRTRAESWPR